MNMLDRTCSLSLPLLDFAQTTDNFPRFSRMLIESLQEHGFVLLHNHPMSYATTVPAFDQAKRFFACDLQTKMSIAIEKSCYHRGYFGFGVEKLDPRGDNKEGLKIGRDLSVDHPFVRAGIPLHGPNQWPVNMHEFRDAMRAYFADCQYTSRILLQALAYGLGAEQCFFDSMIDEPMATLAPLHYCADNLLFETSSTREIQNNGCDNVRGMSAGAHTDYGCITLVEQSGANGLEIYDASTKMWRQVDLPAGVLTMNVGDMLARWSNNTLVSTYHRVRACGERYALAFFFDPNYDAQVACLPQCVSKDKPAMYPPIRALDYLLERIGESFDYFSTH